MTRLNERYHWSDKIPFGVKYQMSGVKSAMLKRDNDHAGNYC